jgi:hypothetical protein
MSTGNRMIPANVVSYNDFIKNPQIGASLVQDAIDILKQGSGSTPPTATLVFRPGGVASGNVFTTAAQIETALNAANGAAIVFIDDSLGSPSGAAGVTWNFQGLGYVQGVSTDSTPILTMPDTFKVLNLGVSSQNVEFLCQSQTEPNFDFTSWLSPAFPNLYFNNCFLSLDASCTGAPIRVPAHGTLFLATFMGSSFDNSAASTVPLVTLGVDADLGTFFCEFFNQPTSTNLPTNLVTGDASAAWDYVGDASAFPVPAFAFAGTLTLRSVDAVPWSETTPGIISAHSVSSVNEPASIVGADGSAIEGLGAVSFGHGFASATFAAAFGNSSVAQADSSFAASNSNAAGEWASAFGSATAQGMNSFAASGADVTSDGSAAIGPFEADFLNEWAIGQTGGPSVDLNSDGAGTVTITCGANNGLAIEEVATQTTVGAAGAASALPAFPLGYLVLLDLNGGGKVVIPYYHQS